MTKLEVSFKVCGTGEVKEVLKGFDALIHALRWGYIVAASRKAE
jgi:hypothetical protein